MDFACGFEISNSEMFSRCRFAYRFDSRDFLQFGALDLLMDFRESNLRYRFETLYTLNLLYPTLGSKTSKVRYIAHKHENPVFDQKASFQCKIHYKVENVSRNTI